VPTEPLPLLSAILQDGGSVGGRSAEAWLQDGTFVLARFAEGVGAVVIAVGVLRALAAWLGQHLPGNRGVETEGIRLGLGRSLGLALEFLLAADILSTAVAPSWDAIGKLAAVATIRTLLNYFLGRELRQEAQRRAATRTPEAPSPGSGEPSAEGRQALWGGLAAPSVRLGED